MKDGTTYLLRTLLRQIYLCCGGMLLVSLVTILLYFDVFSQNVIQPLETTSKPSDPEYDATRLNDSEENKIIKYGHQLFVNTPKYIGPDNGKQEFIFAGNRLACNNCHLYSGTKPFSASLIGIVNRFPQFRARENKIGTIEERINGCMERSMNGKPLPLDGNAMKAFVKYLTWLSRFAPKDGEIEGQGFVNIEIPNRKVDLVKGERVFKMTCIECHGLDGQGKKTDDNFTYQYPPLWGEDSFNNGAGMNRVITAAQFIKANMPFGTTFDAPMLKDEEAYDVAGYVTQQKRPLKDHSEQDFPDLKKKPVSTPYPPYADLFPLEQHQLGPFQPIINYYKQQYNITKTN